MKREIVKIDRELCNGCGECIPNCHEGALQMIDGKATLVSELMCDGLGACLGHCPVGAISIEEREAEAYSEEKVLEEMVKAGPNVVLAHLEHLRDHRQFHFLNQGIQWLNAHRDRLGFQLGPVLEHLQLEKSGELAAEGEKKPPIQHRPAPHPHGGGCPGSQAKSFNRQPVSAMTKARPAVSELTQWPVQLHLVSPHSDYFRQSDLLLAADCTAFASGDFHNRFLKGKSLAIACPKLDSNKEIYIAKLRAMIEENQLNTISVLKMEVPCCGGLLQMAKMAVDASSRKIPVKSITLSIEGEVIQESWE